ncbi:MAG: hypothetical protein K5876_03270 [Ruminiclostridium sp.]|nr:hypothetical protein [Ruminiclostridium sp.]
MLSKVLSKEACAKCGFCCSFRRQSLWELPRMPESFAGEHPVGASGEAIVYEYGAENGSRFCVTDLRGGYRTDDPEEEVRCPFLDPKSGCVLPEGEKPFDCSIWPLRCMRLPDGGLHVCLTPTCPEINRVPEERMRELVSAGLGERILDYAGKYPFMIKEYRTGFTILS